MPEKLHTFTLANLHALLSAAEDLPVALYTGWEGVEHMSCCCVLMMRRSDDAPYPHVLLCFNVPPIDMPHRRCLKSEDIIEAFVLGSTPEPYRNKFVQRLGANKVHEV